MCFHCSSVTLCCSGLLSPLSSPSMSAEMSFFSPPPLSSLLFSFLPHYSLGCFLKCFFFFFLKQTNKKNQSHSLSTLTHLQLNLESWTVVTKRREQRDKQKFGLSNAHMGSFWNNAAVNQLRGKNLFHTKLWLNSGGIVLCNASSVQNAAQHSGGFSCSYSWCQIGGGAGELKGRWRWGKMKGRTRVTSFTWD